MIGKESWRFCKGRVSEIENYDRAVSDYKKVWHCHHRKETPVNGIGMTRKELKERNKLIFDLLEEYEQKESKSFRNADMVRELGVQIDVKLICKG